MFARIFLKPQPGKAPRLALVSDCRGRLQMPRQRRVQQARSDGVIMSRKWPWVLLALVGSVIYGLVYVRTHPLVFMEAHRHCIKFAGGAWEQYASEHDGRYPSHPRGYGNALLLLDGEYFNSLTGPGYDATPFHEAKRSGKDLPEEECGRVFVQGLSKKSALEIVVLFDKLPTPGGRSLPPPLPTVGGARAGGIVHRGYDDVRPRE
jgi:hypothetical protein